MKFTILFILILILAGLFGYRYFYSGAVTPEPEENSQIIRAGDNALFVADQKPGSSVTANIVVLANKGYVVIHQNEDGKPGRIIGNSRVLDEGESKNVIIGLVRSSVDGESLFAMLHGDSGDGFFNPDLDIPVRDEDGNIIHMMFRINRNAPALLEVSF